MQLSSHSVASVATVTPSLPAIRATLTPLRDPERSRKMAAYMKDQFEFLGVSATKRREAVRPLLRELRGAVHYELVEELWAQPEREFQYVACDHLSTAPVRESDVDVLYGLIVRKSWWDSVDALVKTIGRAATPAQMRHWAGDENVWVRRAAILHQLGRKEETDADLLAGIIEANLGSGEFFVDKAIGWALREYSKTDAAWVRDVLARTELAPLSRREASKYL